MQGSGLAGGPVVASAIIPPSGRSAVLASNLGAGAADVVTKAGSTIADALVNATAKVFSVRAGIGAVETEYLSVGKSLTIITSNGSEVARISSGVGIQASLNGYYAFYIPAANTLGGYGSGTTLRLTSEMADGAAAVAHELDTTTAWSTAGAKLMSVRNNNVERAAINYTGRIDQFGTDSTGTPGAATIDKPCGKSAIAAGAATVTITCNQCTAASILLVTFHARDATGLLPVAVPGAGSFTVTTTANCTAALPFSWEVKTIL